MTAVGPGPAGDPAEPDRRWERLTAEECWTLLREHHLGRVAVNDDHGPVILPVNYVLDRDAVVIRTDEGTKLDAAIRGANVAFEIDAVDEQTRTGWSVLLRGRAVEVTAEADRRRLARLPLHPWVPGAKAHYVRIEHNWISGRRLSLPPTMPDHWLG